VAGRRLRQRLCARLRLTADPDLRREVMPGREVHRHELAGRDRSGEGGVRGDRENLVLGTIDPLVACEQGDLGEQSKVRPRWVREEPLKLLHRSPVTEDDRSAPVRST